MIPAYRPTGETALIIVPPADVCNYADYYRAKYMPDDVPRIEPHITITHPFVPYAQLPQAVLKLRDVLAQCPPTRLSLRSFAVFDSDPGVLFLRLADPGRVLSIYRAVLEAFPEYPIYGGKYGDTLEPHMTVGIFTDREEMEQAYNELSIQRLYIGFEVEQVVVKCKMDDGIWDTWAELPLQGVSGRC